MHYAYKEVLSDGEAKRFARNLCKKRAKFASFDDALGFVFRIRTVVSDSEFARMDREQCRRLAWQLERDEKTTRKESPLVGEVAAAAQIVNRPALAPDDFERLLHHLLSVRRMDADDAMDWIEAHYTVQETRNETR